jgi:hypothetical protein
MGIVSEMTLPEVGPNSACFVSNRSFRIIYWPTYKYIRLRYNGMKSGRCRLKVDTFRANENKGSIHTLIQSYSWKRNTAKGVTLVLMTPTR